MQALVLLNVSSLDAFTDVYGNDEAATLAGWMLDKAQRFNGPVYVVDQEWIITEDSWPRVELVHALRGLILSHDLRFLRFDEETTTWREFLKDLKSELKADGVTAVVIGGVWLDPKLNIGAVAEAKQYLSPYFRTYVDRRISGVFKDRRLSS